MTDILEIPHDASLIDMTAIEAQLRPESSERLRSQFHECYHGAARFLAKAAVIVKLLKERGEPLADIPSVGTYLRIASGQVLPELVWKFIESPNRRLVEYLPLADQQRLTADARIPMIEAAPGGGYTHRIVDLVTAPSHVVRVAIGSEGIRSIEEQMAFLGAQKVQETVLRPPSQADESPSEPLKHQITVRLSDSEYKAIRVQAANANIPDRLMVRRLIVRNLKS